mmetsp:Transcript_19367/g.37686  ORF Transcript_19367/g.37686 Transcript_19367/m.37686 type:complete len:269 (+) Transcript_19367:327-1133(+)
MAAVTKEPSFDDALDVESTLWTCKECYVYQIPPLKNESGHRANDWDVNKWLWSGKLVVVAVRDTIEIRLIDEGTGNLFAMCPMPAATSKNVDPVIDSSRYFVLRIDDGKGRHAFIGLGFRDRSDSYDFNATLQDHWKSVQRQVEADEMRKEMEARAATEPLKDLSLKEGEKISIKVNVPGGHKERPARPKPSGGGLTLPPPPGGGLLAPPPPPAAGGLPPPPPAASASAAAVSDDDFGDFADGFQGAGDAGDGDGDDADDGFGDFKAG